MNLNFRKTALLAGICSVFSLGYAPQLFAVSSTDTVEAVQQTKKITGVVSDAMGLWALLSVPMYWKKVQRMV